jgi:uroporphyrinogen decarboxylase
MSFPSSPIVSSVDRINAVLNGKIPDRVPVALHNFMMAAQASGLPFNEYFQDGEAMAEGQIGLWRKFGQDLLLLENGTAALAEACGCQVEYLSNSAPVLHSPAIPNLDCIDQLKIPDPYTAHPLVENLKSTRIVVSEIGRQAYIIGRADQGAFSLASMLLGVENFLIALSNPEQYAKVHALLEFSNEVVYRYAIAQIENGAHMTSIGESLAGPDVTSPRMYKIFEWDYTRRLVARLREKNIPLAYHICGNATRIVEDMTSTGAAILELDYKCDLKKIKQMTAGKTTILGVVDPSAILARGTTEMVRAEVIAELNILGVGGGLVMSPGCGLPPTTPHENIQALIETTHEFGRYQADGSLARSPNA